MTSNYKYIIPACLLVVLISMSFVNVAYADNPVWRETNNLYNSEPFTWNAEGSSRPYRLMLMENVNYLEGGKSYSISFVLDDVPDFATVIAVTKNGQTTYPIYNNASTVTFNLPEDYSNLSIYISSAEEIKTTDVSRIMLNEGDPLPYEPAYSGFRFDFSAIAQMIGQYVQPVITTILPYIFVMIALIIGINAGIRIFRKTAT